MPHLTLKHHALHYAAVGNPNAQPLLMLHGFLGSHQDFSAILSALSQSFYCLTPDFPGHGKTLTEPGYYTFPATAQAFIELLDHLDIASTHLLGYSMGGRLALYLACQWPERFASVVLESASPGLKTAKERRLRVDTDEAIAYKIETLPLSEFLSQWYENALFSSLKSHPKRYQKMLKRRLQNRPADLARALRGLSIGRQPSLWEELEIIRCPLCLLVGEKDQKFVAIAQEIRTLCSRETAVALRIIEGCGHNIHLESPDDYTQQIIAFVGLSHGE